MRCTRRIFIKKFWILYLPINRLNPNSTLSNFPQTKKNRIQVYSRVTTLQKSFLKWRKFVTQKKFALTHSTSLIERIILRFNTRLSTLFYHKLKNHQPSPSPPHTHYHLIPINDNLPNQNLNQPNREPYPLKYPKRKVITFGTAEDNPRRSRHTIPSNGTDENTFYVGQESIDQPSL